MGSAWAISVATLEWFVKLYPMSPLTKRSSHRQYCTYTGWSRPIWCRTESMTLCGVCRNGCDRNALTGSPGAACRM